MFMDKWVGRRRLTDGNTRHAEDRPSGDGSIDRLMDAAALAQHWPLVAVTGVAACLLFVGLGRNYLWEDEGDTAVLARGSRDCTRRPRSFRSR
jgi:hypothetical protein